MLTYKKLCADYSLTPDLKNEAQLKALEEWCYKNVSRDIRFQGNEADIYHRYLDLAQNYLVVFLANMPRNILTKLAQLNNMNPIQYAAEQGYDHFISSLSNTDSNFFDLANDFKMTPLHLSAASGHLYTLISLLNHGANPEIPNNQLELPIQSALFMPILHDEGLQPKKEAIFNELMKKKPASVWHEDESGDTVFHRMAANDFSDLLQNCLIENPKGAFCQNNRLRYPIHTAILNNRPNIAEILLKIPGVSEQVDSKNRTPLHYAEKYGSQDMVRLCRDLSPNKDALDNHI